MYPKVWYCKHMRGRETIHSFIAQNFDMSLKKVCQVFLYLNFKKMVYVYRPILQNLQNEIQY